MVDEILEEEFKELMKDFIPRFGNEQDIEIARLLKMMGTKGGQSHTEIKSRIVHYLKNRS